MAQAVEGPDRRLETPADIAPKPGHHHLVRGSFVPLHSTASLDLNDYLARYETALREWEGWALGDIGP
jgi:hypothetical protein